MQQHLAKEIVIFGVFVADTGHPVDRPPDGETILGNSFKLGLSGKR